MKMKHDYHHIYELCKKHMHSYVLAEMEDGSHFDGIITGLDDENVYMAVPNNEHQDFYGNGHHYPEHNHHYPEHRQFGYGYGYGYPGYGYPGYGYGRPRRFSRLILPLAALTAISALPWY